MTTTATISPLQQLVKSFLQLPSLSLTDYFLCPPAIISCALGIRHTLPLFSANSTLFAVTSFLIPISNLLSSRQFLSISALPFPFHFVAFHFIITASFQFHRPLQLLCIEGLHLHRCSWPSRPCTPRLQTFRKERSACQQQCLGPIGHC